MLHLLKKNFYFKRNSFNFVLLIVCLLMLNKVTYQQDNNCSAQLVNVLVFSDMVKPFCCILECFKRKDLEISIKTNINECHVFECKHCVNGLYMYSLILGIIFDLESFVLFIKFRVNLKRFIYYKSHEFESNNQDDHEFN
jgi:hypothetical protein